MFEHVLGMDRKYAKSGMAFQPKNSKPKLKIKVTPSRKSIHETPDFFRPNSRTHTQPVGLIIKRQQPWLVRNSCHFRIIIPGMEMIKFAPRKTEKTNIILDRLTYPCLENSSEATPPTSKNGYESKLGIHGYPNT